MKYQTLVLSKKGKIAIVSLNRPDVHNAMDEAMMKELTACFKELSKDASSQIIVLTGSGRSFCAGADLTWMKKMVKYKKEENKKDSHILLELFETVASCPKPIIGRINGPAFGGGIGLLAACDITISATDNKFGFSEVNLGIIPAVISSYVAPRMTPADMKRLFLTGERFDAATAHDIGLIDIVVPPERFDATVDYYIEQLLNSGPQAMKEVKLLIKNLMEMDPKKFKEFSVEKIAELRVSKEGQEGITAFLEKRKPKWVE